MKRRMMALVLVGLLAIGGVASAQAHVFDAHPDFAPVLGASPALKDAAGTPGGHQAAGFGAAVEAIGLTMEDVPEHYARQPYSVEVETGTDRLRAPELGAIFAGDTEMRGVGIAGAMVHVIVGGQPIGTAPVAADRTWRFLLPAAAAAGEIYGAFQEAGGRVSHTAWMLVGGGGALPPVAQERSAMPGIAAAVGGETEVRGTGVDGARVNVTVDGVMGPAALVAGGQWRAAVAPLAGGARVTAVQTEPGKMPSDTAVMLVAPGGGGGPAKTAQPSAHPMNAGMNAITGNGVPGATIHVTWGSDSGHTTVLGNAQWAFTFGGFVSSGTVFTVTQEDVNAGTGVSDPIFVTMP